MVKDCSIRLFEAGDLPRLHEIREAAYRPVFQSFRDILGEPIAPLALAGAEREQKEYLDKICAAGSAHEIYVVERSARIVAFCALAFDHDTKIGELDLNAVDPVAQGKGIGAWMYERGLERLKEAGMRVATVGTGGDPSHAPARRAYEKAGFGPGIPNIYFYKAL